MRPSVDHLIQGGGIGLGHKILDIFDTDTKSSLAEGDLNDIALLDGIRSLDLSAIDADMLTVAGIVGNGAALDDARNLQKLIDSHKIGLFPFRG